MIFLAQNFTILILSFLNSYSSPRNPENIAKSKKCDLSYKCSLISVLMVNIR